MDEIRSFYFLCFSGNVISQLPALAICCHASPYHYGLSPGTISQNKAVSSFGYGISKSKVGHITSLYVNNIH